MNSYRPAAPRAAFTLAAVAMTVLTLGLSVLPAKNSGENAGAVASASRAISPAAATSDEGMPIMVYGVRDEETAMQKVHVPHARKVHVPHVGPPQRQQI